MPRQLVALCLVRGVAHNTCVFLPDKSNVSCCKSMAGDVVLHLNQTKNAQEQVQKKSQNKCLKNAKLHQLTCCSVMFWGKPRIITVLLGVACLQSSSPGDLNQFMVTLRFLGRFNVHCSRSVWTCLCSDQDCDLCSSCYPHQLSLSSSGSPSSSYFSLCSSTWKHESESVFWS